MQRLFHIYYSGFLIGFPPYIGQLNSLHELTDFYIPHQHGFLARELQDLKDLRHLHFDGLENVNIEEAAFAKLSKKENLVMLSLTWGSSQQEADNEERVLNNLQPHSNIAKLKIGGYNGPRAPCWMKNPILTNLTYISLSSCHNWQRLRPLGTLPSLKYLYIRHMNAVKRIDHSFYGCQNPFGFQSLKLLYIESLPKLEEWVGTEGRNLFPQLKALYIKGCIALRNVPVLPSTLAYLKINRVGLTTLPATYQPSEATLPQKPLLSRLKISNCPNLVALEQDYYFHGLEELDVAYCENCIAEAGVD